ncbi:MAG: META domain-containing protein [Sphingobacteriales bacterium JAD_PAG50586_3]|nr:MAG: META domain-containing protein [Sphingobacteriales bacterium JAD_PAG50586_3]
MKKYIILTSAVALFAACGPKQNTGDKVKTDSLSTATDTTAPKAVAEDVILTARGSEPFWSLSITKSLIKFKMADKDTVTASDYKMADNSSADKEVYIGGKDFGITVENKPTIDAASGATYQKDVTVSFQGKKYKGVGGAELSTPGNASTKPVTSGISKEPAKPVDKNERITINGKWTLTVLNGKKVGDKEFTNGLATLDINTVDNTGTGFGGCNRFNGSLTIFDGKKIKIEKVISTKMFCEGVPENEYMTVLRNATNFSVVDGKLQLKDNSNKVLAVLVRGVK